MVKFTELLIPGLGNQMLLFPLTQLIFFTPMNLQILVSHFSSGLYIWHVDSERLSTGTSFQLEYEFLDTSEP